MSDDAADQVVRIALNGTEVALRLTGSGVKNLASLLYAWSKSEKRTFGKSRMTRLLESGEELEVLSLDRDTYSEFKHLAKGKLLYAPFVNTQAENGTVDLVLSKKSMAIADYILGRIGSRQPEQQETKAPEKKTKAPSPSPFEDARARSREAENGPFRQTPDAQRESVEAKLETNRIYLKEQAQKHRSRSRKQTRDVAR